MHAVSSENSNVFRKRVREARRLRRLSQTDLSKRTGLAPSVLSDFENGRRTPALHNLGRLADGLDVTSDYLLGRVEGPKTSLQTATGPTVERLIRSASKLPQDDLETLADIADMMAKRVKRRKAE